MKKFSIITIFPESLESYVDASILGKAINKKLIRINLVNLRHFARDARKTVALRQVLRPRAQDRGAQGNREPRRTVDDSPYGGGPGMVLKVEPILRAVQYVKKGEKKDKSKSRVVLFGTRGRQFTQAVARRLAKYNHLIFIAGRYEGVDERIADYVADEEISIGNFILSGGELPALVCLDAIIRHIPGVLGKEESLEEIKGSYPVYTRPPVFRIPSKRGKKIRLASVPKELLSGNHKKVLEWRKKYGKVEYPL